MTGPTRVEIAGGLTIGSASCCGGSSGGCDFSLDACQTVQASLSNSFSVNSPVTWVDLLLGSGITEASLVALRVRNATNFEVRFTTASAADQVQRVSDLFVYSSPVTGQGITALACRGVASLERRIAGT